MNEYFPGEKTFYIYDQHGKLAHQWSDSVLNWKARVVCKPCNEGWMSNIESQHAKPAMADLLMGKVDVPIDQSRARSLALFAFKAAVIFNHMRRNAEPFFTGTMRTRFRKSRIIPSNVHMWLAGFLPRGRGDVRTVYHDGTLPNGNYVEFYACSYAVGHLAFQVLGVKQHRQNRFTVNSGYEDLAIPFWPRVPIGFVWPASRVLKSADEFGRFAERWNTVRVFRN